MGDPEMTSQIEQPKQPRHEALVEEKPFSSSFKLMAPFEHMFVGSSPAVNGRDIFLPEILTDLEKASQGDEQAWERLFTPVYMQEMRSEGTLSPEAVKTIRENREKFPILGASNPFDIKRTVFAVPKGQRIELALSEMDVTGRAKPSWVVRVVKEDQGQQAGKVHYLPQDPRVPDPTDEDPDRVRELFELKTRIDKETGQETDDSPRRIFTLLKPSDADVPEELREGLQPTDRVLVLNIAKPQQQQAVA